MVSDFTEQQHIQSKLYPYNKRLHLLLVHILCNLYLIINTKIPKLNLKNISPSSCYQSNRMTIPSTILQERLIFKANYLLPENKNMNRYVGDILLLVEIPLALVFSSVHYYLNQLIDFDQRE